jgi:sugar phosphate isomerase/epimerase
VRVKAPVVVLHSGSIDMKNYTDKLLEMVAKGEKDSPRYRKLCEEVDKNREAKKESSMERLKAALKKILPVAEARDIQLGLENRQALEELPVETDYHFLFRELPSSSAVYWHDTGHAQIKENLGFLHHAMHLESLQDRLRGFHVHDVQPPGRDHCEPGTGQVDFAALKPFVKPNHLKVFEFSPTLKPEEARRGVEYVKKIWGN